MKRDIFFTEVTPLNFKTNNSSNLPLIQILSIFEILILGLSTILLPTIENTCNNSPLYFWLSAMIVLLNIHLIVTGVENLLSKFNESTSFWFLHMIVLGVNVIWMILGHYWVLYQGVDCYSYQDFVASSILLGLLDFLFLSLLTIAVYNKFR